MSDEKGFLSSDYFVKMAVEDVKHESEKNKIRFYAKKRTNNLEILSNVTTFAISKANIISYSIMLKR